jgi:hypothetical protein
LQLIDPHPISRWQVGVEAQASGSVEAEEVKRPDGRGVCTSHERPALINYRL